MSVWTAFWAERAGHAEADVDHMAQWIEEIVRRHHLPEPEYRDAIHLLADYREHRELRYRALPAGPTKIGSLSSGGIQI